MLNLTEIIEASNGDIATLITAIAALLTAIMTAVFGVGTLVSMKKQRVNTYKPRLYILHQTFFLYNKNRCPFGDNKLKKPCDKHLPVYWTKDGNYSEKDYLRFTVPLVNAGLGSALNVKIDFDFDVEGFATKLSETDTGCETICFSSSNISYSGSKFNGVTSVKPDSRRKAIVLPNNNESHQELIGLPLSYMLLVSWYKYVYQNAPLEQRQKEEWNIPPLKVSLTYNDINNDGYSSIFQMEFKLDSHLIEINKVN
jgi:hypothetical protein